VTESGSPPTDPRVADALFRASLELAPTERAAYLEREAPSDEMRARVKRLLELDEISEGFLEAPKGGLEDRVIAALMESDASAADERATGDAGSSEDGDGEPDRSGERIGAYRLVRLLGRGGMASVWLAERADGAWSGEVAIKVIRKGLDTNDVLRRFRAERQILSSLGHPNICRLLDGGETDSGQPYLVMERVSGRSITSYCDEEKRSVEDRVRVFLEISRAVEFAHRSMIVHRDLKPSNILVDDDGQVKLLDFGIAKLLDPDLWPNNEDVTRSETRMLTPEYASPEQLRGDPVTAASDTFQLGVLLYRLLTGQSPFPEIRSDGSSFQSRLSHQGGPVARPSTSVRRMDTAAASESAGTMGVTPQQLARALDGDLDLILLKSLDEDPGRRYESVRRLADDLEAWLDGRPVGARAPSAGYRTKKFLQRNRWVVPTSAAFLVLLLGYIVSLQRSATEVARERDRAQIEAGTAGQVTGFLVSLFGDTSPYEGGRRDMPARELLDRGAARLREYPVADPVVQARLIHAVADAYYQLDLGADAAALLSEALASTDSDALPAELRLSMVELQGRSLVGSDDYEGARASLTEALEGRMALGEDGTVATIRILAALSEVGFLDGRTDEAIAMTREWLPQARALDGSHNEITLQALDRLFHLSRSAEEWGDPEALAIERLRLAREVYGETTPAVAHTYDDLASHYIRQGDFARAEDPARRALTITETMYGPDNPTTLIALEIVGSILANAGQTEEAFQLQQRVLDGRIEALGEAHIIILITRWRLGSLLRVLGRYEEAEQQLEAAIAPTLAAYGSSSRMTAVMVEQLGLVRQGQGRLSSAAELLTQAGDVYRDAYPPTDLRRVRWTIGWSSLLVDRGFPEDAEEALLELEGLLTDEGPAREALHIDVMEALADFYAGIGRADEAALWSARLTTSE